jgi:hypothetical protein
LEENTVRKLRNSLSLEQQIHFADLMRTHREVFAKPKNGMSYMDAAVFLSEKLGFTVTADQVVRMARCANCDWAPTRSGRQKTSDRFERQQRDIARLARAILALHMAFGSDPADISEIAAIGNPPQEDTQGEK